MPTTLSVLSRAALAATLIAAAACGGNETATSDSAAGAVDTTGLGPGVGDAPMDSGYRAAQDRLDSLKAAGVTPADGILSADSAAARALVADSNTTSRIPPVTATPAPATRP